MKIIVPFSYYFPEQCAGLTIIDDVLKACAEHGVQSYLYVPTPTRNVPKNAKWQNRSRKIRRKHDLKMQNSEIGQEKPRENMT